MVKSFWILLNQIDFCHCGSLWVILGHLNVVSITLGCYKINGRYIGSTAQMKVIPITRCQIRGTRISTRSTRFKQAKIFSFWRIWIISQWLRKSQGWSLLGDLPATSISTWTRWVKHSCLNNNNKSKVFMFARWWPNALFPSRQSSTPWNSLTRTFEVCVGADDESRSVSYVLLNIFELDE